MYTKISKAFKETTGHDLLVQPVNKISVQLFIDNTFVCQVKKTRLKETIAHLVTAVTARHS